MWKHDWKRPPGGTWRRWENNIRIRVGRCGLDAFDSGQRPVADSCKHGIENSGSIKGGEFLD